MATALDITHAPDTLVIPAVTCIVADDHPAVLGAVCGILEDSGIEVVARAREGAEALELIQTLKPKVALLDVRMPRMSGIEIARESLRTTPETGILLYTGYAERALMIEALDAGARGFVLKEAPLPDLVRAVETVADGKTYVDRARRRDRERRGDQGAAVPEPAPARGPAAARRRTQERGDRATALHLARDRAHPRAQGNGQARSRHSHRGRRHGVETVADHLDRGSRSLAAGMAYFSLRLMMRET